MDTMIVFALPEAQTVLATLSALVLGGFTVALAWTYQSHDMPNDD